MDCPGKIIQHKFTSLSDVFDHTTRNTVFFFYPEKNVNLMWAE